MSFWKRLFGGESSQRRDTEQPMLGPNTTREAVTPAETVDPKKLVLDELEKYSAALGNPEAKLIIENMRTSGRSSLNVLKAVARDSTVKLHLRKAAIECSVQFDDEDKIAFLSEFVNGFSETKAWKAFY